MCGSNKQLTGIKDFMMLVSPPPVPSLSAPPRSVCTNIHQCQMLDSTLGPVKGGSKISTTEWETGDAGSQRRDEEEENMVVESGVSSGRRSDINKHASRARSTWRAPSKVRVNRFSPAIFPSHLFVPSSCLTTEPYPAVSRTPSSDTEDERIWNLNLRHDGQVTPPYFTPQQVQDFCEEGKLSVSWKGKHGNKRVRLLES